MKKYMKMTGLILLFLVIYYAAQAVVGVAFGVVYMVTQVLKNNGTIDYTGINGFVAQNMAFILILSILLAFPFYWLVCIVRNEKIFKVTGFTATSHLNLAAASLAGVSISLFFTGLFSFIPIDRLFPDYGELIQSIIGGGSFTLTLISTGIMAPFLEELIFRGFIYRELQKNMPVAAAVVIQAALFGIYHLNLLQGLYAFLIGLIFGLLYIWTRSIWTSIFAHAFVNSTSTVLSRVLSDSFMQNYGMALTLASLVVLAAAVYLVWRRCRGKGAEYIKPGNFNVL